MVGTGFGGRSAVIESSADNSRRADGGDSELRRDSKSFGPKVRTHSRRVGPTIEFDTAGQRHRVACGDLIDIAIAWAL